VFFELLRSGGQQSKRRAIRERGRDKCLMLGSFEREAANFRPVWLLARCDEQATDASAILMKTDESAPNEEQANWRISIRWLRWKQD
jgi:hypothetical protein